MAMKDQGKLRRFVDFLFPPLSSPPPRFTLEELKVRLLAALHRVLPEITAALGGENGSGSEEVPLALQAQIDDLDKRMKALDISKEKCSFIRELASTLSSQNNSNTVFELAKLRGRRRRIRRRFSADFKAFKNCHCTQNQQMPGHGAPWTSNQIDLTLDPATRERLEDDQRAFEELQEIVRQPMPDSPEVPELQAAALMELGEAYGWSP